MDTIPLDTPQKQCTKCKQWKFATLDFFHKRGDRVDAFTSHCKQCRNDAQRKYPILPSGQKRCTKCQGIFPTTTEYFGKRNNIDWRSWCKACRRTYDKVDREKAKIYSREFYAVHKEEHKQWAHEYHKKHPEVGREACRNRTARKQLAQGTHTTKDIQVQHDRQKGRRYYCNGKFSKGKNAYHVDHVVPLSRGGSNDPSNLVLACPSCNESKGAKLPHEWIKGGRLL